MSILGTMGGTIQIHNHSEDNEFTTKKEYSKEELLEALSELEKIINELDQNKKPD